MINPHIIFSTLITLASLAHVGHNKNKDRVDIKIPAYLFDNNRKNVSVTVTIDLEIDQTKEKENICTSNSEESAQFFRKLSSTPPPELPPKRRNSPFYENAKRCNSVDYVYDVPKNYNSLQTETANESQKQNISGTLRKVVKNLSKKNNKKDN
ncbi:hypothetical protein NBO_29g0041 [Nosema bombycis CQ1]|uniref:Uncharacterized protein n=1 Tax=Nosema bombycis (strain CQ1 / CVCC 102059) TaxID=578461 RepID=R0M8T3_NOSB1|nr:hypothetical protein NBO_29g0041 [Nosema bombycis CQ1]|eukprot:EOB14359.1 hypothetical protein NBO_29g0041 [Nosema bombycis CQ1]